MQDEGNSVCIRCDEEIETWEHVWTCRIYNAVEEYRNNLKDDEKVSNYNLVIKDFLMSVFEQSNIMPQYQRSWEIIRGIKSRKIIELANKREQNVILNDLWNCCYTGLKRDI